MYEMVSAFKFIVVVSNSSLIESCKKHTKSEAELSWGIQCGANYLCWEAPNGVFCIHSGWGDSARQTEVA